MSFRQKLSITFCLVLLLTVIVSLTSWWGMRKALNSQKQVYGFQNHIERTFYAMSVQEQAFTVEETVSHSRLVLEHITEMRQQVHAMQASEEDPPQLAQLARVITGLAAYETAFSDYVQQNLEMQTLRTRMEQEAGRLHQRVDELVLQTTLLGRELDHQIITALLRQKEYILSPTPDIRRDIATRISQINELIAIISRQHHSDNIKLLIYRIAKTANTFADIFERFASQQERVADAHRSLREAFYNLNEEFSRAIATKTNLANAHINTLQALIISTAILALMISVAAVIVLSELISRPIAQLRQSALRIVSGDLNTSVQITSRDEIGQLGELFNRMTSRLRASFEELETYRDRLEELVRERTHELELEIIERREAERGLAISEERFRSIFDNSTDGLLLCEPQTERFLLANQTICTMLGYREKELLALTPPDLHPPQDREWIRKDFLLAAAGKTNLSKDIPLQRKDGSVFPAEISSTLINIGGQTILLGCFRDISERKAVEEERLKMRKLESVGVLAGGIAHDFNNILAAILGNASLALALTSEDDQRHQLLMELEKASLRARDLTQQLLTFSKGGEPVKELTAITEIIRESASFILRGSNVRCDFDFADDLWNVEVDAGQISQVIQNIVVNARHAMPEGGVIRIACRNVLVTPQTSDMLAGQSCLEIAITDTGPGIPMELQERIFDPYFTTKQGGSGLGLAITHSVISKHKGIISVNSSPGNGATFTILLPAANRPQVLREKPSPNSITSTAGATILIMDDEEPVRDITRQLLAYLGYATVTAADGQQAFEMYRESLAAGKPIDVVIMDLTIPGGMGGQETARKILALDPQARLVVASGYSHDPIMANYAQHGFSGFLAKPFQLRDLQAALEAVLATGRENTG